MLSPVILSGQQESAGVCDTDLRGKSLADLRPGALGKTGLEMTAETAKRKKKKAKQGGKGFGR